ncbi:MAG: toprim domain-containing protein [Lachnospiraceae bacterium]|nr:toprim domain-containing protein [Lachnospiraceae bacterium]
MISDKTIQRVRDLDIVDVLKSFGVQFQRRGSAMFAHCPFHSERTPSFTANPNKNLFFCHSCKRGGDAIKFVEEKEGLDFYQAVEAIAKVSNIPVEYVQGEQSDEQREAAKHRESLFGVLTLVQQFFTEQLRVEMSDEARAARDYAYNRWPEQFCAEIGIGLAPSNGKTLIEYCKSKAISEDLLLELGILRRDKERGLIYSMFRNRLTIPIRDRLGRVIGFTARYLGDAKADNTGKYINSTNSPIFNKGESIFGIDKANRCRDADYFNIVEGAPDVLRLQSIGIMNTVATNGTAWTDKQFDLLKLRTEAVCFIPDSDVPDSDHHFGPGFEAVIKNGSTAIRKGFFVSVRELPFKEDPETGEQLKNDADEFIVSKEIYAGIAEKNFIEWLAGKLFSAATSSAEERKYLAEIADLLRFINDKILFDELIDALSKIYGKPKSWRMAVDKAKADAAKQAKAKEPQSERERDIELLKKFNLTIRDNCYYTFDGDDEPTRLSNFILEPLFHIEDETNGTRLFRMKNSMGDMRVIELRESDLCSLSAFTQRVGSAGNFVWRAKADKLNNVKEYTYAKTRTAERIRKLGWDIAGEFFAFGNGIFVDGKFKRVDDLGIVSDVHNANYYIPATAKMYQHNHEIFQFERLMVHETNSGITLHDFATKLSEVFGDQSKIALCYLLATLFRDIIYRKTRHFPILNLFGEKGSGKTTLAVCLQSFFLHGIEPPSIGVTSVPAMNDRVSQAVNTFVVFDEYRNDLDVRKIQFLKGMWGGGGQTKKNANTDGMAAQTIVSTGVAVCGQDKPTQDMALFTRLIFLQYNRTVFTAAEQNRCGDLVALCNLGLTHLTLQILSHRSMFEKNFAQAYTLTKSELSAKVEDEEIHSRIFGNWVIPLATFRVLETVLDLPFSYSELFDIALKGMRCQNEFAQESSEVADFWNTLQGMHSAGRCIDKAHFRIRYQRTFRSLSMKEDMIFSESKPILYLNAPAVAALFNGTRAANATANRSNWSTILSYLKSHPSFLGLKQDRFVILTAQGTPDYTIESTTFGTTKKQKVNRPKALCFDYSQLKEAFGLTLETEVMTEAEEINEDAEPTPPAPKPASLFPPSDSEDVPF